MGKRAGQAPVLKRPAAKMCSQPRAFQPGTVPGYASDSMHTASTAANFDAQRRYRVHPRLGMPVLEFSTLFSDQLLAQCTGFGVDRSLDCLRQRCRT